MNTVAKRTHLKFQTNMGIPSSFSIPNGTSDTPLDIALEAAENMIALGILRLHNGTPTALKRIAVVKTSTQDLLA